MATRLRRLTTPPTVTPIEWTLSGSHDGVTYTAVDTRTAQNFTDRRQTRLYEFNNITTYEFYRFDFLTEFGATGANQPNAFQLAEIELFSSGQLGYQSLLDIDVQAQWDAAESSVYQRVEFNVDDPSVFAALSLEMQYDDGFAAYLNGRRVASSNAPSGVLNFQSHATAQNEDEDAVVPELFNLTGRPRRAGCRYECAVHPCAEPDRQQLRPALAASAGRHGGERRGGTVCWLHADADARQRERFAGARVGPAITDVTDHVVAPTANQNITITAAVSPLFFGVEDVTLHYRVMYNTAVDMAMTDDGLGADLLAGDGVFRRP